MLMHCGVCVVPTSSDQHLPRRLVSRHTDRRIFASPQSSTLSAARAQIRQFCASSCIGYLPHVPSVLLRWWRRCGMSMDSWHLSSGIWHHVGSAGSRERLVDRRGRAAAHVDLPNVVKLLAVRQRSPPRSRSGPAGTTTSVAVPVWSWLTPTWGLSMRLVPLDVVTGIERPWGVITAPPYCHSQNGGTIGVKIASSLSRGRSTCEPTFACRAPCRAR